MNLYELSVEAETEIEIGTYKSQNIGAWEFAINPVLKALGENEIGNARVDSITVGSNVLSISLTYWVRGCLLDLTIEIPIEIIKSDDPVTAAKRYVLQNAIDRAEISLKQARELEEQFRKKLIDLKCQMAILTRDNGA